MITYIHGPSGTGKTSILNKVKTLSISLHVPRPELIDGISDEDLTPDKVNEIHALDLVGVPVIIANQQPPSFKFMRLFPDAKTIRLRRIHTIQHS